MARMPPTHAARRTGTLTASRVMVLLGLGWAFAAGAAAPVEVRQRLAVTDPAALAQSAMSTPRAGTPSTVAPTVALTLDACGGGFDADLIDFLVQRRISATIFATRRWLDRNPLGLARLLAHPDLFEIEDHGANHIPAVIGVGRRVYGIAGAPNAGALTEEIEGGAQAILAATGRMPTWYRGATAMYDPQAVVLIQRLGFRLAGFSLNADAGATLPRQAVIARVRRARDGDVILAHMNKPQSDTAEGLVVALADLQAAGFRFVRLSEVPIADVATVPPPLQ